MLWKTECMAYILYRISVQRFLGFVGWVGRVRVRIENWNLGVNACVQVGGKIHIVKSLSTRPWPTAVLLHGWGGKLQRLAGVSFGWMCLPWEVEIPCSTNEYICNLCGVESVASLLLWKFGYLGMPLTFKLGIFIHAMISANTALHPTPLYSALLCSEIGLQYWTEGGELEGTGIWIIQGSEIIWRIWTSAKNSWFKVKHFHPLPESLWQQLSMSHHICCNYCTLPIASFIQKYD
jgi:hypothetical protein